MEIGFISWFFFFFLNCFKILLDRSIIYFVYFDKSPPLLMESRCFSQKPLPVSHSRFSSGYFDGYFKTLMPLSFVPKADIARQFQYLEVGGDAFPYLYWMLAWRRKPRLWLSRISLIYLIVSFLLLTLWLIVFFIYLLTGPTTMVPWARARCDGRRYLSVGRRGMAEAD